MANLVAVGLAVACVRGTSDAGSQQMDFVPLGGAVAKSVLTDLVVAGSVAMFNGVE